MSGNDGYNPNMQVLNMSSSNQTRRERGGPEAIGVQYGGVSHQQVRCTVNGHNHTERTAVSRPWFKALQQWRPDLIEVLIHHSHTDDAKNVTSVSNGIDGDGGAAFTWWGTRLLTTVGANLMGSPVAWEQDTAAVGLMQPGNLYATAPVSPSVRVEESLGGDLLAPESPREEPILFELLPPPPPPLMAHMGTSLQRQVSLVRFVQKCPALEEELFDDAEYFDLPKLELLDLFASGSSCF